MQENYRRDVQYMSVYKIGKFCKHLAVSLKQYMEHGTLKNFVYNTWSS